MRAAFRTLGMALAIGVLACRPDGDHALALGEERFTLSAGEVPVAVRAARAGRRSLIVVRAEIPPTADFRVEPSERPRALASIVGRLEGVAINGGFYDTEGRALDLVRSAGRTIRPLRQSGGSGVLVHDESGFRIVHRDADIPEAAPNALQSIDRIVAEGRSLIGPNARPERDARSAVATFADGSARFYAIFSTEAIAREACESTSCVFELDEASTTSGLSLAELADHLLSEGARAALNLDGGFSTSFEARGGGRHLQVIAHGATINALVVESR